MRNGVLYEAILWLLTWQSILSALSTSVECSGALISSSAPVMLSNRMLNLQNQGRKQTNSVRFGLPNNSRYRSRMQSSSLHGQQRVQLPLDLRQQVARAIFKGDVAKEPQGVGFDFAGYFNTIANVAKESIASTKSYLDLIGRYQSWFKNYKEATGFSSQQVMHVIKIEYTKLSERVIEEAIVNSATDPTITFNSVHLDTVDVVLLEFKSLIDLLENLPLGVLSTVNKQDADKPDVAQQNNYKNDSGDNREIDDRRVQRAFDHVKNTFIREAQKLAESELRNLARVALFNAIASALVPHSSDLTGYLYYMICLVGGNSSRSLLASYLIDAQARTAFSLINRINPVHFIKLKFL